MRQTLKCIVRLIVATGCAMGIQAATMSDIARAINIVIDYRYDNGATPFFNTQAKKDVLQAAADRFSDIITTSLSSANLTDGMFNDPRIGFTHPSTGVDFQVSSASSVAGDSLIAGGAPIANEYRGPWSIPANEWILYAGGRSLTSAAVGGTGTGSNFPDTFNNANSHLNRGFRAVNGTNRLPVWGGVISFDNDGSTNWHFGINTSASGTAIDLYSIALHEIGHALGLGSPSFLDWSSNTNSGQYIGPDAVNAYNDDNNPDLSALNLVSAGNHHWQDGAYDSYIFQNGSPNLVGTVGIGVKQDLIMEPTANFTPTVKRFEMTNVDVAALSDVGWSVLPEINLQPGDYNGDGTVDAADYVVWRKGTASGNYATWRSNFAESTAGAGGGATFPSGVPEPTTLIMLIVSAFAAPRRRRSVLRRHRA